MSFPAKVAANIPRTQDHRLRAKLEKARAVIKDLRRDVAAHDTKLDQARDKFLEHEARLQALETP